MIFCANHASYLDPAFVQIVIRRRVTFVMTNDFYRLPWGRWFFDLVGAIPVGGARLSRTGVRRTIAHVKRGHSVVVCGPPDFAVTLYEHEKSGKDDSQLIASRRACQSPCGSGFARFVFKLFKNGDFSPTRLNLD